MLDLVYTLLLLWSTYGSRRSQEWLQDRNNSKQSLPLCFVISRINKTRGKCIWHNNVPYFLHPLCKARVAPINMQQYVRRILNVNCVYFVPIYNKSYSSTSTNFSKNPTTRNFMKSRLTVLEFLHAEQQKLRSEYLLRFHCERAKNSGGVY